MPRGAILQNYVCISNIFVYYDNHWRTNKWEERNIKLPSQYPRLIVKQINNLSKVIIMTLHKEVKFVSPEYKYFISEVNHFLCLKNSPKDIGDLSLGKNSSNILHNGPWIWQ